MLMFILILKLVVIIVDIDVRLYKRVLILILMRILSFLCRFDIDIDTNTYIHIVTHSIQMNTNETANTSPKHNIHANIYIRTNANTSIIDHTYLHFHTGTNSTPCTN